VRLWYNVRAEGTFRKISNRKPKSTTLDAHAGIRNEMMSTLFFSQLSAVAPTCHVGASAKMEARQRRIKSQLSTVCGVAPKDFRPNEMTARFALSSIVVAAAVSAAIL
jgi:hypothetical protein